MNYRIVETGGEGGINGGIVKPEREGPWPRELAAMLREVGRNSSPADLQPKASANQVMKTSAMYRLQALVGVLYLLAGSAKIAGLGIMAQAFAMSGLGEGIRTVVGSLEIVGGLCLFVPGLSVYAAMLLACTVIAMMGATVGTAARGAIERPSQELRKLPVSTIYRASLHGRASSILSLLREREISASW